MLTEAFTVASEMVGRRDGDATYASTLKVLEHLDSSCSLTELIQFIIIIFFYCMKMNVIYINKHRANKRFGKVWRRDKLVE